MSAPVAAPLLNTGSSDPSTRIFRKANKVVPQGPVATRAYGLKLDADGLHRLGTKFHKQIYGDEKLAGLSPEEARKLIVLRRPATLLRIPREVYTSFPHLPRMRRKIILMDSVAQVWLFVLKDNSSQAALNAHFDLEDICKVREVLGLEHERAKWYEVSVDEWYVS
ncbi:hypothetical protein K466DRAFT_594191 [Polyporus arcularius HHB13444]|uniref:Uncharacterized protein n=1 Tax=Polyporus arcularius HHB13444 TaxID=1314778 RepID=A0A5C3PXZ8_9APHY|nr:hypothetical protein K466DRAFT_594191 [Polyporus arcularius HHB13444]